jgi:transposase
MMGYKARVFQPLQNVTLDDLVPADNFYRHVERTLDLRFVRALAQHTYSAIGRPSIDPVVFFQLQLVLFFEGMRSERQLERVGADRLSVRWYLTSIASGSRVKALDGEIGPGEAVAGTGLDDHVDERD